MDVQVSQIREHMEVVGSDGQHVGTVDHLDGDRIKLTKADDPDGTHAHHHYLACSMVTSVEGNRVQLGVPASEPRAQAIGASH